jgi:diguanylate cyclase (GGDEF)-like protein
MQINPRKTTFARNKLLLLACFVGIGSIILVGWIAVDQSTKALLSQGVESLHSIRLARTSQVEDYFRTIRGQIQELARSRMIGQAVIEFSSAFKDQNDRPAIPTDDESEAYQALHQYYHQEFLTRLPPDSETTESINRYIPTEPASRILQWTYIAGNSNRVGEKDALTDAGLETEYNRVHALYHSILRSYLKTFGYYDIFLFDLDGNVVYTVFKETDFATNFRHGPYRDSNLGAVFRRACDATDAKDSHLEDFESYLPSYGAPASFIASPIFYEGKKVGVIAFQMPLDRINRLLQQKVGLGATGESYLVGHDKKMRTDSRLSRESTLLKVTADSEAVRRAIQGETGNCLAKNYRGRMVASSYSPIEIQDIGWITIAEIEVAELLRPAIRLRNTLLYSGLTIALLAILVSVVAARYLSNEKQERELLYSACLDKLTGLPNRMLFLNRLERAFEKYGKNPQRNLAVLFLDFDRFKAINDSFGHAVGDLLLKEISTRLRSSLNLTDYISDKPETVSVARLGGDEFVVMLDAEKDEANAEDIARILLEVFSDPYILAGHEVRSTASIGIAQANLRYRQAEEILRDADAAMYEAKTSGKACYVAFDQVMQNRVEERRALESDLSMAMKKQQLVVDYQPIFNLMDGKLHAVEAVISWQHPQRGVVHAKDFMAVAEELDLAMPMRIWMLEQACKMQVEWEKSFGERAPQFISVSLPNRGCFSQDTLGTIEGSLHKSGLSPESLQIVFSEKSVMSDVECASHMLSALRSLGVQVAIDDFSRSHSTLAMTQSLSMDAVTIGKDLISCVDKSKSIAAFVHSLALLAHNLKLKTIADGIDSVQQLLAVRTIGCHFGKGNYLGAPMPIRSFQNLIENSKVDSSTVSGAMSFLASMHGGLEIVSIDQNVPS